MESFGVLDCWWDKRSNLKISLLALGCVKKVLLDDQINYFKLLLCQKKKENYCSPTQNNNYLKILFTFVDSGCTFWWWIKVHLDERPASLLRLFRPQHLNRLSNLDKLESDLVSAIKNNCRNYTEIANHLADALVFFCISYICISIQLRLYHNQLKTSCITFNWG